MSLTISHTTHTYPKHIPYQKIADDILGSRYILSLVFVGKERAKKLNKQWRGKEYAPNVLSFPLSKTEGEVYLCPAVAFTQAKKFNMTAQGFIGLLFIHALFHLKGYDHGDVMEKQETRAVQKYKFR